MPCSRQGHGGISRRGCTAKDATMHVARPTGSLAAGPPGQCKTGPHTPLPAHRQVAGVGLEGHALLECHLAAAGGAARVEQRIAGRARLAGGAGAWPRPALLAGAGAAGCIKLLSCGAVCGEGDGGRGVEQGGQLPRQQSGDKLGRKPELATQHAPCRLLHRENTPFA